MIWMLTSRKYSRREIMWVSVWCNLDCFPFLYFRFWTKSICHLSVISCRAYWSYWSENHLLISFCFLSSCSSISPSIFLSSFSRQHLPLKPLSSFLPLAQSFIFARDGTSLTLSSLSYLCSSWDWKMFLVYPSWDHFDCCECLNWPSHGRLLIY